MRVVYAARGISVLNLQAGTVLCGLWTTLTSSSTPRTEISVASLPSLSSLIRSASVGIPRTATYLLLSSRSSHLSSSQCLQAMRTRLSAARKIRKMQVPAYWPVLVGVQSEENSVVAVEVKKAIIIDEACIVLDDDDPESPAIDIHEECE